MLIAVVGGKLQGVEAVYLAKKAGWKTLVIDKNPDVPAAGYVTGSWNLNLVLIIPYPKIARKWILSFRQSRRMMY